MSVNDPQGLERMLAARDTAKTLLNSSKFNAQDLESFEQPVIQQVLYLCDQQAIVNERLSFQQKEMYSVAANIAVESRPTPSYLRR